MLLQQRFDLVTKKRKPLLGVSAVDGHHENADVCQSTNQEHRSNTVEKSRFWPHQFGQHTAR